jgi:hypothetical protein
VRRARECGDGVVFDMVVVVKSAWEGVEWK